MICPVCDTQSTDMGYKHPEATIYRCSSCDHCFSDPISIQDPETYSKEYFSSVHKNWFDNPNIALFDILNDIISSFKVNASVIDIGCGRGDFLRYLKSKNKKLALTGLDLYENQSTNNIIFIRKDFMSYDTSNKYDVVVSLCVIEHLFDIRTFVYNVKKLVPKSNLIIISTINERSVLYGLARFVYRLGFKMPFERLYGKHHLNHFNKSSLAYLLKLNNLVIKKTIDHDIEINSIDLPASFNVYGVSQVARTIIYFIFLIGKLFGRTYLQTVICTANLDNNLPSYYSNSH